MATYLLLVSGRINSRVVLVFPPQHCLCIKIFLSIRNVSTAILLLPNHLGKSVFFFNK